jgi:ATP-binding cassette subfamily F protein uup
MDKIVDHLLIFHGNGEVQDFPGNYTQYREWKKLQPKAEEVSSSKIQDSSSKGTAASYRNDTRRRLSYKEKQEFQQLERDIEALTLEKAAAEEALSSGTLSVEEITKLSERFQVVTQQLDEKEMRWLELSEYA